MKNIYESVALGKAAVVELSDLISDERNDEKKQILEGVRFAYYYLIKNMTDQFGVTKMNVIDALIENGYPLEMASSIEERYEMWACRVRKCNERNDNT